MTLAPTDAPAATSGLNIVYIRVDSLETGYTALADELKRLQDNATKAQENLQKKGSDLQKEVTAFQNKVQQGLIAPNQMQSEQARLGRKEQEILQQREIALGSIQQDQFELTQKFSEEVKAILEALRAENGYDFIFNEGGGGLLMAADAHDITPLVLERLNAAEVDLGIEGEE